tara:strand:+ start:52 stop:342 length:291 start_codon:yes stop_codon:yes gene_type:complete
LIVKVFDFNVYGIYFLSISARCKDYLVLVWEPEFFTGSCHIENQPIGDWVVNSLWGIVGGASVFDREVQSAHNAVSVQDLDSSNQIITVNMAVWHL